MAITRAGDLFDHLAPRYDRGNRIMSLGTDTGWRRRAIQALAPVKPGFYIDAGAGTGDLSRLLVAAAPGARVIAMDASRAMLAAGLAHDDVLRAAADATCMPVARGSVRGIVTGFLLRNLPDIDAFFAECARVLEPGGRLVVLEISRPRGRIRGTAFDLWFGRVGPAVAGAVTGQPSAYRYLAQSLWGFPSPQQLAASAQQVGLQNVELVIGSWTGIFLLTLEKIPPPAGAVPYR